MIYTEIRPDLNSDYNNRDDHFGSADASDIKNIKKTNHHLLMKWIQRLFEFTDMAIKYDEYQIITNCRC